MSKITQPSTPETSFRSHGQRIRVTSHTVVHKRYLSQHPELRHILLGIYLIIGIYAKIKVRRSRFLLSNKARKPILG